MKALKFFTALLVLGVIMNCSKISEKVEEKVNEKVNEKIDENLKKIDSTFDKKKLDSLMKSLDTLKSKADSLFE
ncbi:MAG: hypothetical protein ABI543_15945, partial [Ignavibacteria bacterium]